MDVKIILKIHLQQKQANILSKRDEYRGKYSLKKFCESLGEYEMKIIYF